MECGALMLKSKDVAESSWLFGTENKNEEFKTLEEAELFMKALL